VVTLDDVFLIAIDVRLVQRTDEGVAAVVVVLFIECGDSNDALGLEGLRVLTRHRYGALSPNRNALRALDERRLAALRVDQQIFLALFVLETDLVEVVGAAAW
jgi:hypothetical protein